jgi:hypothetical protein
MNDKIMNWILTIAVVALASIAIWDRTQGASAPGTATQATASTQGVPQLQPDGGLKVGDKAQIPGVDEKGSTLVLAISPACHFCVESEPFFNKLTASTKAKIVIVAPNATEAKSHYKFRKDVVTEVADQSAIAPGTPTVLLIRDGKVSKVWKGRSTPQREAEILKEVQS